MVSPLVTYSGARFPHRLVGPTFVAQWKEDSERNRPSTTECNGERSFLFFEIETDGCVFSLEDRTFIEKTVQLIDGIVLMITAKQKNLFSFF